MIPAKVKQMNTTALAYMGDAVYEVYVRRHVMESGQINADRLHYMAVPFVRAHGQATALKEMMKGFLTEEEASLARRARNHKTTSRPKNADPVEYKLSGINQVAVNRRSGLTFAAGLRSVVRQDPDVIMLGEIRDEETAAMAVHAALTGHLVLSTLHTNDAIGAVYRLLDMGIADYLLAAGLRGVLAQRLLRRPCRYCGERRLATAAELQYLGYSADEKLQVVQAHGCEHCHGTGYRGRLALHELIVFDKRMQQLLVNGADEAELLQEARKQGWRSLYADAVAKVLQGATTVEELWRVGITGEADYA